MQMIAIRVMEIDLGDRHARHINAVGVMLIQAMGIGLVGVINWVYLIAILRRTNGQEAEAAGTTTRSSPH